MEGIKQGGKPPRGVDLSPLTLLRRSCPELFSSITSMRERYMKNGSNGGLNGSGESGSGDVTHELDGMATMHRLGTASEKSTGGGFNIGSCANSRSETAVVTPPTPSLRPMESMPNKKVNALPNKRRRRDGMNSLSGMATTAASPSFFTPSASSGLEESSGSSSGGAIAAPSCSHNNCGTRNGKKSPRFLLREASTNSAKGEERSIPEDFGANYPDGMAFVQLLQQCSGGVRVSLKCSENCSDERGSTVGGGGSSLSMAPNPSSSSLNGSLVLPMGRLSKRELQTQLSAALALASSAANGMDDDEDEDDDDDDDDAGTAMRLPHPIFETASKFEHPPEILDILQCMGPSWRLIEGVDAKSAVDAVCKNVCVDSDRNGDGGDDEEEEDHPYYDEDIDDLKETIDKMGPLSLHTMRELANWWGIQLGEENETLYRMSITEHLRLLAVTIVAVVSDRLELQMSSISSPQSLPLAGNHRHRGNNNGNDLVDGGEGRNGDKGIKSKATKSTTDATDLIIHEDDERDERVRGLLLSLRHDICMLNADHLRYFSSMLGFVDRCCTPEEIFMTISAVGVLTFFSPLPTPLLKRVCRELSIPTIDDVTESVDANQLPELLAEKVSHYFYPLRLSASFITKLPFMPQMQIHEHAPGRYTCTVDNTKLMKVLSLQRLVSNRFSCSKIKWHALLTVVNDEMSFYIWHRHSKSIVVHVVVRTQDPKKKRKNSSQKGKADAEIENNINSTGASLNNETSLRETSALFLEKKVEVEPGELVGFENFISLPVALRSSTMSQSGYRLYNRTEDRLVFQCAVDLTFTDSAPLVEDRKDKLDTNQQKSKNTSSKQGIASNIATTSTKNNHEDINAERSSSKQCVASTMAATNTKTTTTAMEEKRRKEWGKNVQKLEKSETQDRESVEQAWNNAYRQLVNELNKAYQKALQKKKDRERKALLAKVGPSPELQRELDTLTQAIDTNRAQVTKLANEKAKEEDAIRRFSEQIEEGNRELERLRQLLKKRTEELTSLEAETAACTARIKEREEAKRRKQRELAMVLQFSELPTTRHETLAINDLQSFWSPARSNSMTTRNLATLSPTYSSTQCSPQLLAETAPSIAPVNVSTTNTITSTLAGGSNSISVGPSIPLPRSAAVVNNSAAFMSPPTYAAAAISSTSAISGTGVLTTVAGTSAGGVVDTGLSTWAPLTESLSFTSVRRTSTSGVYDNSPNTFSTQPLSQPTDVIQHTGVDVYGSSVTKHCNNGNLGSGFTVTAPFTNPVTTNRFTLDANARPFTPTSTVPGQAPSSSASHSNFTLNAGGATASQRSPISTSPMAAYSGNSSVLASGVFPEKPRYTSVSTPVPGGAVGSGLFTTDPLQVSAPLFASPGLQNGTGKTSHQNGSGFSLNFTTAPWN